MVMRWFKKRGNPAAEAKAQKVPAEPKPAINLDDPALRNDPEIQRKRVAAAADSKAAIALINDLNPDQAARIPLYLARRDLSDAIWQDAALTDEPGLVAIEHHSRSHNKTVNREARSRLKALRAQRATRATLQQRAQQLISSAQRINLGSELTERDITARALLDEQWQQLETQWQTVIGSAPQGESKLQPLPQLNPNLPRAEDIAAAKQAAELAAIQQAASQAAADKAAQQAERDAKAAVNAEQTANVLADQTNAALQRLQERSSQVDALLATVEKTQHDRGVSPGPARQERREQRTQLARLLKTIDWPTGAERPEAVVAIEGAQIAVAETIKSLDGQCEVEKTRLEAAVAKLTETLAAGQTREAGALHADIRRARPESVGLGKAAMSALGRASGELRQLGSWQQFATSPKRQELCDAMQVAAQTPQEPTLQAERIKALRSQWQALGPPREEADRAALKQFDAHAEAAFEPCRIHFAALAQEREANATARESICAQLEQYLSETDWRSADYDAADRIMREARNSWRGFHPVPRKLESTLSTRFEALQESLYQKLKDFWNSNATAKQALIDQAVSLGGSETTPLSERIDQAKRLQSDWKRIGRVPRKQDQSLWQDFRKACDALFEERDAKANEETQRVDSQRTVVAQLLTAFTTTLAETTSTTADAAVLKTFRGNIREQVTSLPGPMQRSMEADAKKLMGSYQSLLDEAGRSAVIAGIRNHQRWDSAASTEPNQQPQDAPDDLFAASQSCSASEWHERLQRLTVSAEMAADIDSPAADQPLRMALKVERLQQSMGNSTATGVERDVQEQARQWCQLGRKPNDAVTAGLRERFFDALEAQTSH